MTRRVFIDLRSLLCAVMLVVGLAPLAAQQPTVLSISPATREIDSYLLRGRQLEIENRWADALTHYEEGVRQFPQDSGIQYRYDLARLHYDVERRFADRSFRENLTHLTTAASLDLYRQILLKIESHYVDSPRWKDLVDRGTLGVEVALSEAPFLRHNLPLEAMDAKRIDLYRRTLRGTIAARTIRSREDAVQAVAVAADLAQKQLGLVPTVVVLEYLCGATNSLDPYSAFLTPDQLNEVYSQIEGNFVGLGVELKAAEGELAIQHVITGSPAESAGIRAGDHIIAIDGQATAALSSDQAANLLQGEENTRVQVTLRSPNGQTRTLSVLRRRVEVPSVDQITLLDREKGVGYCKLTCFQKTTPQNLDAALWKLQGQGMKSLIIDVRGNPGGLLLAAVEVVDRFVDQGVIVSTRGRNIQEDSTFNAHPGETWRTPLVVLIDNESASAAEIFAGAIRELKRGVVLGSRSFGKGSVQGIFPLDGTTAGIRLTTAKFYSPSGRGYNRVGVEPDRVVRQAARPVDGTLPMSEDYVLAAALQAARQYVAE